MIIKFDVTKKDLFAFSFDVIVKKQLIFVSFLMIIFAYLYSDKNIKSIATNGINSNDILMIILIYLTFVFVFTLIILVPFIIKYLFFSTSKYKNMLGHVDMEIKEDKLIYRLNGNVEEVLLKNIIKIGKTKRRVYLYITKVTAYIVPRELLENILSDLEVFIKK